MTEIKSIGFLGAGQMATAIIKGLISSKVLNPSSIFAFDVDSQRLKHVTKETGIQAVQSNREVVQKSEVVVIAVKPDIVSTVLSEISSEIDVKGHLIISIAAGIKMEEYERGLPSNTKIVRVMPNVNCLVGCTAAAFCVNKACTEKECNVTQKIFSAVGLCSQIQEKLMDAVTAVSGSGPAYVFQFIEALADGGVLAGLPRNVALQLAAQTVMGSAKMVLESKKHPGELKDSVASPGGTTIAALYELEKGGLRGLVMSAVKAAKEKSEALGKR